MIHYTYIHSDHLRLWLREQHNPSTMSMDYSKETSACKQASLRFLPLVAEGKWMNIIGKLRLVFLHNLIIHAPMHFNNYDILRSPVNDIGVLK